MSFGEKDISREARIHVGGGEYEGPASGSYGIHVTAGGQDALERAEQMLEGIPDGIERAVSSAINRAAAHLRSASTRAARERYAISAANIRAEENVSVAYTYQNGVQAYIHFSGKRIPLYRFDGASPAQPTYDTSKWNMVMRGLDAQGEGKWFPVHPGIAASGHVLKSTSPRRFETAFVATVKAGKGRTHTGIFERTGGMTGNNKDEIKELFGPSVPQMLGSQEVAEKLSNEAMESFVNKMEQDGYALMSGYISVR